VEAANLQFRNEFKLKARNAMREVMAEMAMRSDDVYRAIGAQVCDYFVV
jgi:hypothetical protein